MWQRFFELAKFVFTLGQQTQKHQASLEAQQQEIDRLADAMRQMHYEVQRLRDEIGHFHSDERHEREKMTLRLENVLLRFEHRLPSSPTKNERLLDAPPEE